ncbi:P-loop NTPase fold protein [Pedobacter jeongneungensis]|uniref:KAP family P-loop NTPase fold protein n=1 Tax=Pedobacter jeongneungensis TaxID=947309 RepID=UPI000468AF38|nr:P-loop NTPase fold protein [Pedobacter jeongneungensis]
MWNDKETDVDLLGYEKIAETIYEIVKDNHLRPLTIGVYGDWGVGKSSILALLQKKVKKLDKQEQKKIHTIMFNGWLFQGYEDTKSALMETIVTDLARLQPNVEKIKTLTKSLLKRINWLKVAKVSAGVLWTGMTGIPHPGLVGEAVSFVKGVGEKIGVSGYAKDSGDDAWLKEEEEQTVPSQIHAFRKEFKELIETSQIEQLIILVDDLDRCLPKAVIEILEAIRLFLFVEGTVFVISADERMIEYAVRDHFPNLPSDYKDYTRNYLEKLIQIPIRVPLMNKLQTGNYIKFLMLQNHLGNNMEEMERIYGVYESKKKLPYESVELTYDIVKEAFGGASEQLRKTLLVGDTLYPVLSTGLKGNPRNTKRFLNSLFLRMKIGAIHGLKDLIRLDVLSKLMLLEIFNDERYQELVNQVSGAEDGKYSEAAVFEDAELDDTALNPAMVKWNKLEPSLKDEDLRPYIFISKEKAISFDKENLLSQTVVSMLKQLGTGSLMELNAAERELQQIGQQDANLIFDKLIENAKKLERLTSQPNEVKGLYRVIKIFPNLEIKFLDFLATRPATSLGPWAITESNFITTAAKERFNELLETWKVQATGALKTLAGQSPSLK